MKYTKNNVSANVMQVQIPEPLENIKLPAPELLMFYKDVERRVYWLLGEVDDALYDLVQRIMHWNAEDNGLPVKDRKPIRIIIASGGESLEIEKTVSAIIELSKTPVYGIAIGVCASAASMIFLSCHKRFALSNATFVFHQGSCQDLGETYQQVLSFRENYAKDIQDMSDFYKSHTKYPHDVIDDKLTTGDWYINTKEALKYGIVDEIIHSIDVFV